MIGRGLIPCIWPCRSTPNWACCTKIRPTLTKCTNCTNSAKINTATPGCTAVTIIFGGGTPTSIRPIPSRMAKIVTGRGATVGYLRHWRGRWTSCRHPIPIVTSIFKTSTEMAAAFKPIQREDGFWTVSLHDPDHFGGPETSGTAFFVYGLAWGLNASLLSVDDYEETMLKGWNATGQ